MVGLTEREYRVMAQEALILAQEQLENERKSQNFQLFGNNLQALRSREKEILLCGPTRTGKSFAWLVKLHQLATRFSRFRGLICRKTRASLSESALQTFEQQVLGPAHPLVVNGPRRRYRETYIYPNGAEIVIDGMDKKTKILSTEFDVIFCQEAIEFSEDDIEYLLTRLSNTGIPISEGRYFHQLAMDANPDHPKHWLKQRVDRNTTHYLTSRHEDNPRFYNQTTQQWTPLGQEYIFDTLEQLSGVRYKRFRLGLWEAAEGQIYDEWREQLHVIERFDIPAHWDRIRVIDFGFKNPFVCQWWAIAPIGTTEYERGTMFMYRELYVTGKLVQDVAPQIKHLSGEYDHPSVIAYCYENNITQRNERERITTTICDHDAEDRATLERYGIHNIAAFKGVALGIQAVQARVKLRYGKSRLYIFNDALTDSDPTLADSKRPTKTQDEITGYVWEKDKEGKPLKEQPLKIDDHGCDTMRYAVCYVDHIGSELIEQQVAIIESYSEYDDISIY